MQEKNEIQPHTRICFHKGVGIYAKNTESHLLKEQQDESVKLKRIYQEISSREEEIRNEF